MRGCRDLTAASFSVREAKKCAQIFGQISKEGLQVCILYDRIGACNIDLSNYMRNRRVRFY